MSTGAKLQTVEAARAVAALAVLLFHVEVMGVAAGLPPIPAFGPLVHGVDFFFVISGFIIFHVHRGDVGRPVAIRRYLANRVIRLYPLLWLIAGGVIALKSMIDAPPDGILTSLTLLPSMEVPIPTAVWTLRHEIVFYFAFAILILSRRLGILLFAIWGVASLIQMIAGIYGAAAQGLASFFLSPYSIDFLLGALVARTSRRQPGSSLTLIAGCALLLVITQFPWTTRLGTLDYTSVGATVGVVALGCCFALILHGLLQIEHRVTVPRWLTMLGGASYALYLAHLPLLGVLLAIPSRIVWIVVSIAVAVGIHLLFEKPVTHFLRKWAANALADGCADPPAVAGPQDRGRPEGPINIP